MCFTAYGLVRLLSWQWWLLFLRQCRHHCWLVLLFYPFIHVQAYFGPGGGGGGWLTNKQPTTKKTCELSTLYLRLHLFTKQNYEKQRHRSLDNDTLFAIIQIIYHQHRRTPKTKKERPRETESQRESRTTQLCIKRSRTMSNHVLYERHTDNDLSSTF